MKYAIRFRNFILTGGSYHWLAAFLADAEHVIYPEHTYMWHGDITVILNGQKGGKNLHQSDISC